MIYQSSVKNIEYDVTQFQHSVHCKHSFIFRCRKHSVLQPALVYQCSSFCMPYLANVCCLFSFFYPLLLENQICQYLTFWCFCGQIEYFLCSVNPWLSWQLSFLSFMHNSLVITEIVSMSPFLSDVLFNL